MSSSKLISNLDKEYLRVLRKIKLHVTSIMNTKYIDLIKMWLERLNYKTSCPSKRLRNTYLERLCKQIQMRKLEPPFTAPPPKKLCLIATNESKSTCSKGGRGDSRKTSELEEEAQLCWVEVSEFNSTSQNEEDTSDLLNVMQLENDKLIQFISRNKYNIQLNKGLNDKIIELQKQLANAMIRNVELQKTNQNLQEQRDKYQQEYGEAHQKELERIRENYQQTLDEREKLLKVNVESKCTDFSNKYNTLQEWYTNKIADQEHAFRTKCELHEKELDKLKTKHEQDHKKLLQKQKDDIALIKSLEAKITAMKQEHQMQTEKLLSNQHNKLEELRIESKQKIESQATQYKKRLEEERERLHKQVVDKRAKHEEEMNVIKADHQKELSSIRTEYYQKLADRQKVIDQLRSKQNQLIVSKEECVGFKRQIDDLMIQLNRQDIKYQGLHDKRKEYYERQVEINREIYDCNAAELAKDYQDRLKLQKAAHQKELERVKQKADDIQKQNLGLLKTLQETNVVHKQELDQLVKDNNLQIQLVKRDMEKEIEQRRAADLKYVEEQREAQKNLLEKFRMNVVEQKRATEIQHQHCLESEMVLKDECLKLYADVKSLRSEKEIALEQIHSLKKEVSRLREMLAKLRLLYVRTKKDYYKRVQKMRIYLSQREKKYRVLLSSAHVGNSRGEQYDQLLAELEEKYKRLVGKFHLENTERRKKSAKRIAELELRLGLRLLRRVAV